MICKSIGGEALTSGAMRLTKMFAVFAAVLPFVFLASVIMHHRFSPDPLIGFADARILENVPLPPSSVSNPSPRSSDARFIDGLLHEGFNSSDCSSRYQSHLHRKPSPHKPSPYLISKLRQYEDRHRRCGPGTKPYNEALAQLASRNPEIAAGSCSYVVWISYSGLGNRILSIASTFLYAILTNRVLLVDRGSSMEDLFCEPFPSSSWLLPLDFPLLNQFPSFNHFSASSFGQLIKTNAIKPDTIHPFVYLHLSHDYTNDDKLFFCDEQQSLLHHIPWLIIRTDNYFAPSLFLSESFGKKLAPMFPNKTTVFHHLGRYLFHPTDVVWGLVTRYHSAYMAKADERIGIQIRVFDERPGPLDHVTEQLLACINKEKILPQVLPPSSSSSFPVKYPKTKSVLLTSLSRGYAEILSTVYWESPTSTGEVVGVHQPSTEGFQQTERGEHTRKAWAEMYLLSLTDALVTSAWSTFGYVAQGLGGMRPWILYKPENDTYPDPPCARAASMEPCFHAPPFYDCELKRGADSGALVPHVRHCEDMSWGLKIFG